ncbi:hypothetical protein SteCoe_34070 [Stentor coeruleus]|uniref:C2H2-type domain-containing protein n=1 Tax=Stentor coeruleus TaxID=5963 RepID=A0A1R2AVB1_9CILI|nr:hypothetical protein SteCoe_34070 [Stentor coeruleus]
MKEIVKREKKVYVETVQCKVEKLKKRKEGPLKKKYRCKDCMKMLSSKQSLREHRYSHQDIKPYVCSLCNKTFRHGSQLTNHKKTHKNDSMLSIPLLTSLLQKIPKDPAALLIITEKIRLPLISKQQSFELPNIESYLRPL